MFTTREWEYLKNLEKRKHEISLELCAGTEPQKMPWDPLEKPMSVQERKIRSSIQRKMSLNAKELACAFQSGMPPQKRLFQVGVRSLEKMILLFKGFRWVESLREEGDLKEIIDTKYLFLSSEYNFGSAGNLIRPIAKALRDEFRAKNPELYDALEKKQDEEIKRARQSSFEKSVPAIG